MDVEEPILPSGLGNLSSPRWVFDRTPGWNLVPASASNLAVSFLALPEDRLLAGSSKESVTGLSRGIAVSPSVGSSETWAGRVANAKKRHPRLDQWTQWK